MHSHTWRNEIAKFVQAGKTEEAITLAHTLAKNQDPNNVATLLIDLGIVLGKQKSLHDNALSLFEAASHIATEKRCKEYANYNASVALTIIGDSLGEKRQLKEAERFLQKAVNLTPSFSLAHQRYGRCLHLLGKKKKAEYHFKLALKLDPKGATTHAFYALLLSSSKKPLKAVTHLEQAVKLEPNNSDFHTLLGMALLEMHCFGKAESEFKSAIDLKPANLAAHYHYGILLGKMSRWSEAEAQLKKVFDTDASFENIGELYPHSILMKYSFNPRKPITEEWQWARQRYFVTERPLDIEDFQLSEKHRKEWRVIYDRFACEMCGRCCKGTKWAVNLDTRLIWEDIERWRREERHDILRYVLVFEGLGGDLLDLKNKKFLPKCPFLKRREDKKYVCSIHETKPFACRITPFYFHTRGVCENCREPISEEDIYCENCGMFLKADPHMLLLGCPGLKKALKMTGLYKPFRKLSLLEMIKLG